MHLRNVLVIAAALSLCPLCRADGLEDRLEALATAHHGKVAIAVKRLTTGESFYLNADEYHNLQVQTRGTFGGLGMEVTDDHGRIKVVTPLDDTPASRAGVALPAENRPKGLTAQRPVGSQAIFNLEEWSCFPGQACRRATG